MSNGNGQGWPLWAQVLVGGGAVAIAGAVGKLWWTKSRIEAVVRAADRETFGKVNELLDAHIERQNQEIKRLDEKILAAIALHVECERREAVLQERVGALEKRLA